MIGAFLINDADDVCFAQYGEHEPIAGLRLVEEHSCVILLEDGSEDLCTASLEDAVVHALRLKTNILIAHLDDEGDPVTEYRVPISRAD